MVCVLPGWELVLARDLRFINPLIREDLPTQDAIEAIADKALERKTGARGLRSIMESVMMDTMYEIPSDDTIEECVVTKAAVDGESEPLTIHDESLKKAK